MEKTNKNGVAIILAVCLALGFIALIAGFIVRGKQVGYGFPDTGSQAAAAFASLSSATNFSVLAALSASSANTTVVSGDLGLSPGLAVSRTGPWTVSGTEYFGPSSAAFGAQADALVAFNNLAAQTSDGTWSLNPNPLPGVWTAASSATFSGTLTLDGNYSDVWVFQVGQDFTFTGSIVMAGNAQPCNVFWQVGRDVTIASGSTFVGTIIADRDITLVSGATVDGRVISLTGALTTDGNTISGPTCTPAPPGPATLHIIKSVVNVSGTATAPDFLVHVKSATSTLDVSGSPFAGTSSPGTLYTLPAGAYIVSEDSNPAFPTYAPSFGLDCVGGTFTLTSGEDKICTVVNTDIPVPVAAPPPVSRGGGGGGGISLPLISIVKVPSTLLLSAGPGPVTYNYTVKNIGGISAVDVTVADDKCAPVVRLSGDVNNNNKLDSTESWSYSCSAVLSTTTTNTAVATGYSDDIYHNVAAASTVATVVVAVPGFPNTGSLPPLINIVKVPSRLSPFPFGGGDVTYTYTVTNPGLVPLHNVAVTDDKCAPVSRNSGDTNNDNLLDLGESWVYTCLTNVPVSTRNVGTAKGTANGYIAVGYAFSTVLVSAPRLPNTGFPPKGINIK